MNNNTAVFIYDGKEILAETTTEGTKTNIFGNNMIATTGTDTLYYQYNNHGDVVRVLDQSGTLKNEYDYDAFGNAITEKETVKNPYRYAGYYQDTESGLYYLRSRYYNPKTARFLTEDTASGKYTDPLSLNKYTYCHNQPVTGYDPDGYALHIFAGAVVGGLIGGAMSYASQAWQNKSFTKGIDWKQVAGGAAEGAITGAIGAATGGASLAATAATSGLKTAGKLAVKKFAINTASGFVGNTANQLISNGGNSYNVKEALMSGLTENIDIPGFQFGEKTAKKVGSEIVEKATDNLQKKAGNIIADSVGSPSIAKNIGTSADAGIGNTGIGIMPSKQMVSDATSVHKTDFFIGPEGATKSLDEYDAFVENGLYTDDFLKSAATEIHGAQYGDAWWGKMNPVSITQATDGTVVISKNNGIIGKKSRAKAQELFGDKAIIVGGRGANFDNSKWKFKTQKPKHAEARGIQALLSRGIDVKYARQATTLPSCGHCSGLQDDFKIKNITGSVN